MTKKEFEERTGYTIPEDRYKEIEAMYLEAGEDIDKDAFCKDFKQHSDSVLLYRYYQQSTKLKISSTNSELKDSKPHDFSLRKLPR